MNNYLITYDLNKQGQDYANLINAIQNYNNIHVMYSVWFIKSNKTATEINNELLNYIDENDRIFVSEITNNKNWYLKQDDWNFLNN